MHIKKDLVSIIIVTYNSADYVIETLNSCLAQTYTKIEIIISDDGSTDETLQLCQYWQQKVSSKFDVKIITSTERKGIPANCNRGAKIANGEWLKFLGADDLLEKKAVEQLMNCTDENVDLIFSKFITFGEYISKDEVEVYPFPFTWNLIKQRKQRWNKKLEWLFLLGFSNVAPGAFIRRSAYKDLDGYDESFYLLEDLPLWYRFFSGKFSIGYCDLITVRYRIHKNQVTSNGISALLKKDLLKFTNNERSKYTIPYWHNRFQISILSNKKYSKLKYINVFQWYISLYNRFGK